METLQQMAAVASVLAALGGAVWLLRNRRFGGRGNQMAVLERLTLTPQHTLCLVKIGDRKMLIGTSPSMCQVLSGAAMQGSGDIE